MGLIEIISSIFEIKINILSFLSYMIIEALSIKASTKKIIYNEWTY